MMSLPLPFRHRAFLLGWSIIYTYVYIIGANMAEINHNKLGITTPDTPYLVI